MASAICLYANSVLWGKGKGLGTCYSAIYTSQTRDQQLECPTASTFACTAYTIRATVISHSIFGSSSVV